MRDNYTVVRIFVIGALFSFSLLETYAQISRPTPVSGGSSATYSYDDGSIYTRANWQISQGSLTSFSSSGTTYSCIVTWNSCSTTGTVTFKNLTTTISSKS